MVGLIRNLQSWGLLNAEENLSSAKNVSLPIVKNTRKFDNKFINKQYVCRWIVLKTKALEIRNALIKAHLVEIWKG